jgi:hypothetical protein
MHSFFHVVEKKSGQHHTDAGQDEHPDDGDNHDRSPIRRTGIDGPVSPVLLWPDDDPTRAAA